MHDVGEYTESTSGVLHVIDRKDDLENCVPEGSSYLYYTPTTDMYHKNIFIDEVQYSVPSLYHKHSRSV